MRDIIVRRYINDDESAICEIIKKDALAENIKDYPKDVISHLIESHNEELIRKRAKEFHYQMIKIKT